MPRSKGPYRAAPGEGEQGVEVVRTEPGALDLGADHVLAATTVAWLS